MLFYTTASSMCHVKKISQGLIPRVTHSVAYSNLNVKEQRVLYVNLRNEHTFLYTSQGLERQTIDWRRTGTSLSLAKAQSDLR